MASARLEILVEPFKEDQPGPHVAAAIEVLGRAGLSVEMGPFSSAADGDLDTIVGAIGDALRASFLAGADRIRVSVEAT